MVAPLVRVSASKRTRLADSQWTRMRVPPWAAIGRGRKLPKCSHVKTFTEHKVERLSVLSGLLGTDSERLCTVHCLRKFNQR